MDKYLFCLQLTPKFNKNNNNIQKKSYYNTNEHINANTNENANVNENDNQNEKKVEINKSKNDLKYVEKTLLIYLP